ncbi:MAG: hypothetical protein JSS97_08915 [Actinobacteria bacterium]|nr:hypothetical protein [Actinomycetota bacterium]
MTGRKALGAAVAVMVALAAVGVVAASAGAARSHILPQGFRYAAEIKAKVTYDGTYKIHQAGFQRCSTGEGETKVPTHEEATLHIDRVATFSHITVPVALPDELGKAVAKLGLQPTITTPGKISQDHSTLDIEDSLAVPNTESEGCRAETVVCHWDLSAAPGSGLEEITAHDLGDKLTTWAINVLGVNRVTGPPCAVGEGGGELSTVLADSKKLYPEGLTNFPEVVISTALGNHFHQLLDKPRLSFNPVINTPESGSANCATHLNEEEESCTNSVTGTTAIELHRLFFYKTKQAYSR